MRAVPARVGAVLVDSLPFSQSGTFMNAVALKDAGVHALAGYLGVINKDRLAGLLSAGLGYLPVTLAGEYNDGAGDEVAQLKALSIPTGTTVFLDMEGLAAFNTDPKVIIEKVNRWSADILAAGYVPGLYVGAPQPLTSFELWKLSSQRYWRGQGSVRDRNGALAEPTGCGWCVTQMWPSVTLAGTLVDCNMVGQDYKSRVPTWVVK